MKCSYVKMLLGLVLALAGSRSFGMEGDDHISRPASAASGATEPNPDRELLMLEPRHVEGEGLAPEPAIRVGGELELELYHAISFGREDDVRRLIAQGADLNAYIYGEPPLYRAVKCGEQSIANILLEAASEIGRRAGVLRTLLAIDDLAAVMGDFPPELTVLVLPSLFSPQQIVDVNARDGWGHTILRCALYEWHTSPEMIQMLIDYGAHE
jgi:hypothetical protein